MWRDVGLGGQLSAAARSCLEPRESCDPTADLQMVGLSHSDFSSFLVPYSRQAVQ